MSGELSLIAAFEELLRPRSERVVRWVGDDAAVVRARPFAVTSVDAMVDGVHFRLDHPGVTAADAGHRALAGRALGPRGDGRRRRRGLRRARRAAPASGPTPCSTACGAMEALAARTRRRRSPAATSCARPALTSR